MQSSSLQLAKPMTPVKVVSHRVLVDDTVDQHHQAPASSAGRGGGESNSNNNHVDFIGPSNAVKHLFSLPYSNDRNVSVALHNIGNGTLLLDSGEDFGGDGSATAAASVYHEVEEGGINNSMRGRARRRRQRPSSWSIKEEYAATTEEEDVELNQSQLAQLREGERSLLASLSLLLEEEKHQQLQHSIVSDEGGAGGDISQVVSSEGSPIPRRMEPDENIPNSNENALVVPSNAIVVANKKTEPIVSANGSARSATNTTTQTSNMGDPNSDPLISKLPPPQHYLSHVVAPPTEPRQYVDWKFHDMKLLIASDAVIYNHGEAGAANHQQNPNNDENFVDEKTMTESIAIRVADASDLKSQMKYHENMVKEGLFVAQEGSDDDRNDHRRALPPSSYAEALKLIPSSSDEEDHGGQDNMTVSKEDDENNQVVANVKLQTCIIPASGGVGPELAQLGFSVSPFPPTTAVSEDISGDANTISSGNASSPSRVGAVGTNNERPSTNSPPSPVCTVLDAYLDNLMANVPQLALILREQGFVQNIKLLRTEDIPSLMMHPSTLGDESAPSSAHPPPVFDPNIVEMNAAMLLRFLKTNCTRENSTYLLRRAANTTEIQLFDISSISELRVQRKWVWWLALCSYRFACRLEQLQVTCPTHLDGATRREYRTRQRSLLHNTLNLFEQLADMDDGSGSKGRHETIGAAVCEHLADTYLWNDGETEGDNGGVNRRDSSSKTAPAPCAMSSQPYRNVTVDCLDRAHDHLMNGIKKLTPLLSKAKQRQRVENSNNGGSGSSMEVEAISTQLYGIHQKIVNICLRLADHHLRNYFSSNLIQSLRTAARMLSDAVSLLGPLDIFQFSGSRTTGNNNSDSSNLYARSILLQYAWLWEYCGHFARSFAADGLWRDRGHTCGADLIGLFREVNASCGSIRKACFGKAAGAANNNSSRSLRSKTTLVTVASHGQVSLDFLSGIVILPHDFEQIEASVLQKEGCHEAISAAKSILDRKTQIKRDARLVLVAACVCYGHAIDSYVFLANNQKEEEDVINNTKTSTTTSGFSEKNEKDVSVDNGLNLTSMTPNGSAPVLAAPLLRQRLGDACNEIGKILLSESRAVLLPHFSPPRDKIGMMANTSFGMSHVSAIMLASAQFWFLEGLARFTEGHDLRNLALLRCNLCQCCKIRANTNVILPGSSSEDSKKNNSESYLQDAVNHLVSAHDAMGQRDADPVTWDMVSEELAATLLVLGVRRRQSTLSSSSPEPLMLQALRLTPGAEKSIVEPMERSCKIYESLGTARASHQAAAAHYQLALYFSKVWTCQRDEAKTREKLAAAFKHYGLAHRYFFQHTQENETTFVVLSLDFSNLYSAVSSEEECLSKALLCCLDTRTAFSSLPLVAAAPASSSSAGTMEQMATLAENIEARVSKLLLSLVKIEKEKNSKLLTAASRKSLSDKYRSMYRKVLAYKITSSGEKNNKSIDQEEGVEDPPPTFPIFELLKSLSEELF